MFSLFSLLSIGQQDPPVIQLSASSSGGYHGAGLDRGADTLYENPKRHEFSASSSGLDPASGFPPTPPVPSVTTSKGKERVNTIPTTTPRVKMEAISTKPFGDNISSISRALPVPTSTTRTQPLTSTGVSSSMGRLRAELKNLLEQKLPNAQAADIDHIVVSLSKCGEGKADIVEDLAGFALRESPLGAQDRSDLIAALVAQVFDYQINRRASPPSHQASPRAPEAKRVKPAIYGLPITSHERSFTSGSSGGAFHYYTTVSTYALDKPPPTPSLSVPGDVFIHLNINMDERQVWLYNKDNQWEDISEMWENRDTLVHPTISDRVLTIRPDNTPNWILLSSLLSARRRSQSRSTSVGI